MPRLLAERRRESLRTLALLALLATMVLADPACKSSPCMYGICVDGEEANSSSYRCYCIDGYTGINCEINWDECWSNPCLNGGTCHDAIAAYNCTCPEGFVGVNCEQRYSQCMSQPCLNNATCFDHNHAGVTCQCREGFSGEFCEIDASVCNSSVCKNSGECVEGPGLSFSCQCAEGWLGTLCEQDLDECSRARSPCQNGGLCINLPGGYQCACLFGFSGKDCDKPVVACHDNPCLNSAVCLLEDGQPVCYCVPDFHGLLCELRYDDCESKYARCQNGGSCVDGVNSFTCACPPPYAGDSCDSLSTDPLPDTTTSAPPPPPTTTTTLPPTSSPLPTSIATSSSSASTELPTSLMVDDIGATSDFQTLDTTTTTTTTSGRPALGPEARTEFDLVTDLDVTTTSLPDLDLTTTATSIDSTIAAAVTLVTTNVVTVATTNGSGTISTSSSSSSSTDLIQFGTESTLPTASRDGASQQPGGSERPTEADYAESMSSLTTLAAATSAATTAGVVTMLPSSIPSLDLDSTAGSWSPQTDADTAATTLAASTATATAASTTAASDDFTSLTDFHRSTFGSDIDDGSSTPPTSAGSERPPDQPPGGPVHACTSEQCANTTRCLYNASQCDCSYRDNCRARSPVSNAAFNGKSYIRQKFGIDSGSLSILLRLKTRANSGILIHALFDDERYVLLYMEAGQLKFQFSCGLQTMLFGELDSPVNNGHDVDLEMRFQYIVEQVSDRCSARLLVNGSVAMSGEQLLHTHEAVPQVARLHLGGIPLAFSRQFPQIVLGFVGCVSLLKVNGLERDFVRDSVEAVQIEECNSFLCLSNPCKNFGACQELDAATIECKCIAGYSGQFCERSICDDDPCHLGATCLMSPGVNFLCVCPLGAHGLFCEKDTAIVQPSFSVFAPGFSSYMAYGVSSSLKDGMELSMRIVPQNPEQISLIAYVGQSGPRRESSDHLSVTYVRGYLMLTWDLGSGVRRIFTASPINARARKAHGLQVGRRGRDAWLYVEGVGNVSAQAAGANTRLDVSPILYIGGHKAKYFDSLPHDLPLHSGFSGCIYDVELRTDDSVHPITMSSPATGRGVGECHRNECSHHSCKNGAVCLNYGPTYSCICMKDWQGPDCSHPVNCTTSANSCH